MCAFRKPDKMASVQQQIHSSSQEIQELKELCCYLHDERAKLINLVSEWKKFGKHIFGTMQIQKETYKKEIMNLELHEQRLLNELQHMKEYIENKGNFTGVANLDLESVRKGGDGSSSSSPTNIISNKNEFKKNDIYMNPRDAISSPASLDSYKHLSKYTPSHTYLPSHEYTGHNTSSDYAGSNTINAYDIKKFHHSMPRQRPPSNSTMRSSYGSDNVSLDLRTPSDNVTSNQLHYTTHFNEFKYPLMNDKFQPGFTDIKYQMAFLDPKYQPTQDIDPNSQRNIKYLTQLSNSGKNPSNQLSEEERAMYRKMCKSVWQNLGKSTTYKTAV